MEGRINYDQLEQELFDGDETVRLNALRRIIGEPIFEGGQVTRFLKAVRVKLNDHSVAVRFYAKKAFARLKKMTRIPDIGIILPEDIEEAIGAEAEEPPTYVYGSKDYWRYELGSIDYKIRIKAVMELSKSPDEESYKRLFQLADRETHDHVIATLAKYLSYWKRPDTFFRVKDWLYHHDARVRANTIEGFGVLGDSKAVPLVMPFLRDPDNRIRANAARFLVVFHPDEVVRNIREMLASSDEWTKASALFLLTKVEVPQVEGLLIDALRDSSEEVLEKAVLGLGYNGTTARAREALERIRAGEDPAGAGPRDFSVRVKDAATGALELFERRLESRRAVHAQ